MRLRAHNDLVCIFRINVTARFGNVTDRFGAT